MKTFLPALVFLFSFSSSFSQIKLDSGLVAYYPFNGNADDASGNGNNAIFNNASLTDDRFGNPNSAYSFNGIDNCIRIPNAPAINPVGQISLCVFVKPMGFYRGSCHGNSILMKGDADYLPGNYVLRFDDNAYTSGANCRTSIVDTVHQNFYSINAQTSPPGYSPYITEGQWACIVYTYDGSKGKFYVDGALKDSQLIAGISFSNTYDLFLGRLNAPAFPYWFNGVMDEVRIYNRAINESEVFALCPSGALPVQLTDFEANVSGKQIKLIWNIENEDEIADFTIERSPTGHADFMPLGNIVAGDNIRSYSFVDNSANQNQNYYYRLNMREKTGAKSYSEIRTAKVTGKNKVILINPNPSNGSFGIKIYGYNGSGKFTIINPVGQVIFRKIEKIIDNSLLSFDIENQSPGIYWLNVETEKDRYVLKIMIF